MEVHLPELTVGPGLSHLRISERENFSALEVSYPRNILLAVSIGKKKTTEKDYLLPICNTKTGAFQTFIVENQRNERQSM